MYFVGNLYINDYELSSIKLIVCVYVYVHVCMGVQVSVCMFVYHIFLPALGIKPRPPAWVESALTIGPFCPYHVSTTVIIGFHFNKTYPYAVYISFVEFKSMV